jgi:peptidoglycan/LPS O-acetylase OafA/YrhL
MKIKYRPEIDGLRALAVLSVVFFHAKITGGDLELFSGGYIGVDVFFVISGYLITSIILKGFREDNFSFGEFYERRVRRILPALFAVLITLVPVALFLLVPWQLIGFAKSILATLFFVSNIFFWSQSGYFAQNAAEMPLLHTWSLAIEEQFYILFPLSVFLIWKFFPKYLHLLLTMAVFISLYMAITTTPEQPDTSFFLLNSRLWELLCGAVLATLESEYGRAKYKLLSSIMPAIGLGLITYSVLFFSEQTPHPGYYTLIPVAGTMLFIWFCRSGELVTNFFSMRPVVFIGLISYSLYLWHYPIYAFLNAINIDLNNYQSMLVIFFSFVLSISTYHLIEKPFRRKTIALKQVFSYCIVSSIILITCSTVALTSDGGMGRYNPADLELVKTSPKQHGEYVNRRASELLNRPFEDNDETKVLIIGDSYSYDLVNTIVETGMNSNIQLSLYSISRRCGNLFIEIDVSDEIEDNYKKFCEQQAGYNNPEIQMRMKQADVIWLASSWELWQAELLPQSLENISALTNASLLVLGRKDFGDINPYDLINIPIDERLNARMSVSSSHWRTNEQMETALDQDIFINLQEILCDGLQTCPVFDDDLHLISYDGNHLTRAGAIFLGNKLRKHSVVVRALSEK